MTRTDHDEREQLSASPRIVGQRGRLEQIDDVIPDPDGVTGGLERERVLRDSRYDPDVGARAHCENETIVLNFLPDGGPAMASDQPAATEIDAFDRHLTELDAEGAAEGADRIDDVSRLDRAGRRLGEHRREQKEDSVTDQR